MNISLSSRYITKSRTTFARARARNNVTIYSFHVYIFIDRTNNPRLFPYSGKCNLIIIDTPRVEGTRNFSGQGRRCLLERDRSDRVSRRNGRNSGRCGVVGTDAPPRQRRDACSFYSETTLDRYIFICTLN